ncbi:ABC transporter ATP-binding protein [Candidatus Woesearchaeota archaeon]|nr:MAG: ABC transporter ATP-binding protein [Candidatus Woesearchaeota archaeon]
MAHTVFKVNNITKVFGKHVVLKDLTFDINAGEIFGIIGTSGSGKTTLLNTIIGFLRPEIGNILFREEHLLNFKDEDAFVSVSEKPFDLKRIIGFAAQTPSFYGELTALENLEYFGTLHGLSYDALRTNINTLLKLMELEEFKNTKSKNLSGGMARRLDIACALVHDPKVLILDEPTADLDPILRNHIWKLIQKINNKGTTIILSSHLLNEIELLCHRIAILHEGTIIDIGTMEEIKNKFSKNEEIHIETYPGNYKELAKLADADIARIENKGHELVIYTKKPSKVLKLMLSKIETMNEKIIDLKVNKPSLDDVFMSLAKKKEEK